MVVVAFAALCALLPDVENLGGEKVELFFIVRMLFLLCVHSGGVKI